MAIRGNTMTKIADALTPTGAKCRSTKFGEQLALTVLSNEFWYL
jgi:hypothetical protein